MRFSRISLENWRNFGQVDVPLQTRAFLVGANASGKSNFLDAFRFLRDLVSAGGGFQRAVRDRRGVALIRNLAARPPAASVALEVDLQEGRRLVWRYRIAFAQDKQRQPVLKEEKVWQGNKLILDRPDEQDQFDEKRLQQTYLEQTFANRRFRKMAEFFASVHYYHLIPQLVRDPERSMGRRADPYGGDFLEQVTLTAKRTRDSRLRRILDVLRVATPQLRGLKLDRDEHGGYHLYGQYEHWPRHAWQTEVDFSDGSLRLIGMLWSWLDGDGPLLLEEPELTLHPDFVRRLPQMMEQVRRRRRQATRQVLVSTHSSDLLRSEDIAADEVLLFVPSSKGGDVTVGTEIADFQRLLEEGLTAADVAIPRTRPSDVLQLSLLDD
jgi:predicted ATPase